MSYSQWLLLLHRDSGRRVLLPVAEEWEGRLGYGGEAALGQLRRATRPDRGQLWPAPGSS
jgi:hypothetical protein